MARRNRRVHSPYGEYPGIGDPDDAGGQQEPGGGRQGEGEGDGGPGYVGEMGDRAQQFVSDRPHTSLVTVFSVGFGLGLLVTLLLKREEEESWFERYAPDAIQDLPERFQHARHKVTSAMPGSFKEAGETLASYVPSSWKRW